MKKDAPLALLATLSVASLAACGDETNEPSSEASSTRSTSGEASVAGGPWTYEAPGYDDVTVTLDQAPDVVVADAFTTQAIWPYGARPEAMWGYGQNDESMKHVDTSELENFGKDAEFNLEKLVALDPDLIIGYGNDAGDGYTWWDEKFTEQVADVAPYLAFDYGRAGNEMSVSGFIEAYQDLAIALGGQTDTPEVTQSRGRFEEAQKNLGDVLAERDDLTFALFAPWEDKIWFANRIIPQVKMLESLGMQFTGPTSPEGSWTEGSWENMPALKADVALVNMQGGDSYRDLPLYQQLHAVKADQVFEWDDKRPYTYDSYAEWMEQLTAGSNSSEDIV